MPKKPFLTNFAVERIADNSDLHFRYDNDLDMNISDDIDSLKEQIVCSTKTYTKVFNEQPDRDVNPNFDVLYSTQTYTKVKTERPDTDITEYYANG